MPSRLLGIEIRPSGIPFYPHLYNKVARYERTLIFGFAFHEKMASTVRILLLSFTFILSLLKKFAASSFLPVQNSYKLCYPIERKSKTPFYQKSREQGNDLDNESTNVTNNQKNTDLSRRDIAILGVGGLGENVFLHLFRENNKHASPNHRHILHDFNDDI